MPHSKLFRAYCLAIGTILGIYWPLSHWLFSDLYHQLLGFAPGSYDPDFVKIIGTMGIMPVAGFFCSALRPESSGAFLVAFMLWCFAMCATYVHVITAGHFPAAEYFNAALVFVTGLTDVPAVMRQRRRSTGDGSFPWDADYLHYFVREPYPSRTTQASLVIGRIAEMRVISEMPDNGVVFSDGVEADFLEFNSGTEATIGVAEKHGVLVL